VEYTLGSQTSMANENATFTTKELAGYGEACAGKVNGDAPLGVLTRSSTTTNEFSAASGEFAKKIGEYYYRYSTPQSACATSEEAQDLQTTTVQQFKPSIVTLEAVSE
jgi:hypothetical protein